MDIEELNMNGINNQEDIEFLRKQGLCRGGWSDD
jgi:hypothetical protein